MTNFWKNKKVVVTGADGFIGSHAVEQLVQYGASVAAWVRTLQLKNIASDVQKKITITRVDLNDSQSIKKAQGGEQIVINFAASVGGIEYNMKHPASMFRNNLSLFLNLIDLYKNASLEKFCIVSSACVYPRSCSIPTPEEEGFKDMPEETNIGYGWAKRTEELLGQWYHQEFGVDVCIARPYNAYGPRDNFDPSSSHVIPALIRRMFSDENPVRVWGSGKQTRSFLYVKDFARGVLEICAKSSTPQAINLGTDEEITIKELVYAIREIAGVKKGIIFDTSKPEGQPRRNCDTTLLKQKIGFKPHYSLKEGLKETIEYYKEHYL